MDTEGREKGSSLYRVLKGAVPRTRGVNTLEEGGRVILQLYYMRCSTGKVEIKGIRWCLEKKKERIDISD